MSGPGQAVQDVSLDALNVSLVVIGSYLFLYRLLMIGRCRELVIFLTNVACGASFVFFAPVATWFPEEFRVPSMLILGGLFGTCCSLSSVFAADVTVSAYLGSLLWKLSLCRATAHLGVDDMHFMVMTMFSVVFVLVFCATPVGPMLYERLTLPMLSAALVSSGLAGMLPAYQAVSASALLGGGCDASEGDVLVNLKCFGALTILGALVQGVVLFRRAQMLKETQRQKNEMAKSLLPEAVPDQNEGGLTQWHVEDESEATSHFQTLVRAIYAPEGTNQDHLNDHDKKLVHVCRTDDFERDRVVWGGGLI